MKKIDVVCGIIYRDGKVFATVKGYGEFKGFWEFPGGKVEEGESPKVALQREVKEELDSLVLVEDLVMKVEYDYPNFHLSMKAYWCKLIEGNLTLKEALEGRWLLKEELLDLNWLPANKKLVEKIGEVMEEN